MPTQTFELHATTPETHKVRKIVEMLRDGAVMLYPTDSGFALGCCLSKKNAIERVRQIRRLPEHKHLSFLCDSLTNISEFAKVSNHAYKIIRRLIPGPFTFILPATKAVPNYALDPKRKTTGIRVPESPIAIAILKELDNPLISITAKRDDQEFETVEDLLNALSPLVDIVVTPSEYAFVGESTVIDMTQEEFHLVRRGAGMAEVREHIPEIIEGE
ncbi:MAG: threonylcarbamoyl-AMP synthase [Candidatus Kapaibacterium sp.]|nr:MAG: threonylcarbamoyl-AMP synthase [Candidatus Kapabacteria bacterium]